MARYLMYLSAALVITNYTLEDPHIKIIKYSETARIKKSIPLQIITLSL